LRSYHHKNTYIEKHNFIVYFQYSYFIYMMLMDIVLICYSSTIYKTLLRTIVSKLYVYLIFLIHNFKLIKRKSMKKIITIGSATQDIFLHIDEKIFQKNVNGHNYIAFEEGSKIVVNDIHYATGGGATNAAAALTLLNHDTYPVCKIASDPAGIFILEDLKARGIPTTAITIGSNKPTAVSYILPSPSGNRVILAYRGANATLQEQDIPFELIGKSDGLYITSLATELHKVLLAIVQHARASNLFISLNPGKTQLKQKELLEVLRFIDILTLNEKEAQILYDTLGLIEFSLETYATAILQRGPNIVIVTRGDQGVFVATREKQYTFPALKVEVKNTVGAGDAFSSTFFGMLMHGKDIEQSVTAGLRNSAVILQGKDTKDGLLNLADLG
jgi:ribokinase